MNDSNNWLVIMGTIQHPSMLYPTLLFQNVENFLTVFIALPTSSVSVVNMCLAPIYLRVTIPAPGEFACTMLSDAQASQCWFSGQCFARLLKALLLFVLYSAC